VIAAFLFGISLYPQTETALQLATGVTTTLKRTGQDESFSVTAAAGQTLLVELDADERGRNEGRVQVFAPGVPSTSPLVSSLGKAAIDTWMYLLPAAGTYQVRIHLSSKKRYEVRLTLMDRRDPRLEVGIRPEQISILDPNKELTWDTNEFFPPAAALPLFGPASLESGGGRLHITIVSTEGFKKAWSLDGEGEQRMALLESALKTGASADPRKFPGSIREVSHTTFVARQQLIEGPQIRAIRWLCSYDQPAAPVSPLGYAAEGITADGRFFVTAHAAIYHPAVPDHDLHLRGARLRDFRAQLARQLEGAPADSFEPSLERFDAMVQSLTIR
jgi:hypothetical protein